MPKENRGSKADRPYSPEDLLRKTNNVSAGSFILPNAIWHRIERLVECADEGGMDVTRNDMMGAVVASIEFDPESLVKMMLKYRTSTAADVGMNGEDQS